MSKEIQIKFRDVDDANNVDLTRIGVVAGESGDGATVLIEPDIEGWDGVDFEVSAEILRSAFAAVGVIVDVFDAKGVALATGGGTGW